MCFNTRVTWAWVWTETAEVAGLVSSPRYREGAGWDSAEEQCPGDAERRGGEL